MDCMFIFFFHMLQVSALLMKPTRRIRNFQLAMISNTLKVDDITQHRFSVAPMMEYTDTHQRKLMRMLTKKSVLYTEMVTANALLRGDDIVRFLEADFAIEEPVVMQLGGSDPDQIYKASKIVSDYGYKQININCGCPSEKVAGAGCFGAALMLNPDLVSELCKSVYTATGSSATIKCRIGMDSQIKLVLYNTANMVILALT